MTKNALTRTITIHGIETDCSIGWHDHERAKNQKVIIDIAVRLAGEPDGDDVATTLDYDELRKMVLAIAAARHFDLQETLARQIFDAAYKMDGVTGVAVETCKPDAYPDCRGVSYRLSDIG